ncbi:DNA repair photolyase [Elusimicrobium posterum]|uniref:SPL family radical SAM protein n=1 Tax=Elusimicrobium posterum TaxID=3116653 RepID=UPI003C74589D
MKYIDAKHIVTKVKPSPFWFDTDYNMNIYRGCCHGCIYCDSRSDCYHIDNFDEVRAKKDALAIIRKDLASKRTKGVVATGAMSDPYNPAEKELCLTRGALELLKEYGFGLALATKSPLVTRDIDIIKEINKTADVIIKITITCADDETSKKIEPFTVPSSQRFAALKELSDAGIFCGILLMPLLPFINDTKENIAGIVTAAAKNGAGFIYFAPGVTLRMNQRDYFYDKLDILFPGVKEKYIKMFGDSYSCNSPHSKMLYKFFEGECKKHGILYKMSDIIKAYKKTRLPAQPELF